MIPDNEKGGLRWNLAAKVVKINELQYLMFIYFIFFS